MRLMLEVSGKLPGNGYRDVGREEGGLDVVMSMTKQEVENPFPVLFCPYLKHKGTIFNQLPAIMMYLGEENGLAPNNPVDRGHAMQFILTIGDILSEAEYAYHPVSKKQSYKS